MKKLKLSSKKAAYTALLLAVALIIGTIEHSLPSIIPALPFVRIGFSNIVLIFAVVVLGAPYAFVIAIIKAVAVPLFVGNPIMILYSLPSSLISLGGATALIYLRKFSLITVSPLSSVIHNMCQLTVAYFMTQSALVFSYAPYLIFVGIIAGVVTGLITQLLIKVFPKTLIAKMNLDY